MIIPVWLDMMILLATFLFTAMQHLLVRDLGWFNKRQILMLLCIVTMVVTVFHDTANLPLSYLILAVALSCALGSWILFRSIPRNVPKHTRL